MVNLIKIRVSRGQPFFESIFGEYLEITIGCSNLEPRILSHEINTKIVPSKDITKISWYEIAVGFREPVFTGFAKSDLFSS